MQSLGYEIGLLLDYLEAEGSDAEALARYEFMFFRLLDDHRQPRALFARLGGAPSLFVDLVSRVYRGKNEPHRQLDEHEATLAHHAWWVLNHWDDVPGRGEDGTVDGEHLKQWVRDARFALADTYRADIGDEQVGQVLAASPPGDDGVWPAEPVRTVGPWAPVEHVPARAAVQAILASSTRDPVGARSSRSAVVAGAEEDLVRLVGADHVVSR